VFYFAQESSLFVIVGVIICFLDAYIICAGLNIASCAAIRVVLSLGPACMYSGLLTKTLRIVIIFQSTNVLKKHVREIYSVRFRQQQAIFTVSCNCLFLLNPNVPAVGLMITKTTKENLVSVFRFCLTNLLVKILL